MTHKRKVPQGKIAVFCPKCSEKQGTFFQIQGSFLGKAGQFFSIFKKGQRRLTPLPFMIVARPKYFL